ncbi:spectrin beta chain, partial [Tropilaelaps mercedesae]
EFGEWLLVANEGPLKGGPSLVVASAAGEVGAVIGVDMSREGDTAVKSGAVEFEKNRIRQLQEERLHIQKKTFTKWMNSYLSRARMEVDDLFTDLSDGRKLLKLLEIISGERLGKPNNGKMRVHKIENVNKALTFLHTKSLILLQQPPVASRKSTRQSFRSECSRRKPVDKAESEDGLPSATVFPG